MNQGGLLHYRCIPSIKQYRTFRAFNDKKKTKDSVFIGGMGLVGCFGISLALEEKYDIIYLLGYDFGSNSSNPKHTHWYQDLSGIETVKSYGMGNPRVYRDKSDRIKNFVTCFDFYKQCEGKIYNVSLESNISTFEIISYDQFFEKIKVSK